MRLFQVTTPSQKSLLVSWNYKSVSPDEILVYEKKQKFESLCELFCKNYGNKWACPPKSPAFRDYCNGKDRLIIVLFSMKLEQLEYIAHGYLKIKAANSILKSRIDRLVRSIAKELGGNAVSTGSCRLCKPCKIRSGKPCFHPDKMAYSFEALGINVEKMTKDMLNHELLWYKDKNLPEYTSVVAGVLISNKTGIDELIQQQIYSL